MARIRTIKPEFWESESVGRLSFGARLLFIASLNFADDEGLLRWNEAYLASQAFVYDESITESISEYMNELVTEQIILPYRAGQTNQRLAWIVCFRNHQVINRPQPPKLPPPSYQNVDFQRAIFRRDGMRCRLCGEEISEFGSHNESGSLVGSIDHIVPKSKGGSDYPSNLQAAHISCNKSKGNKQKTDSVNDSLTERKGREWKGSNKPMRFAQFWDAYPKKKSKGDAEKAFNKISPDEPLFNAMLTAIEAQKKTAEWQKEHGQFIPYPASWLNAKGWEDEAAPADKPKLGGLSLY